MSTNYHYCPSDVVEFNVRLGSTLEQRFEMTLATWKTVKWAVMGLGVVTVMQAGGPPTFTILAVALILAGPEVLEYIAVREDVDEYLEQQDDE
jgi:hypothetical protein